MDAGREQASAELDTYFADRTNWSHAANLTNGHASDTAIAVPGHLDRRGLELNPGLPRQRWEEIGRQLARAERALRWWVGDWLNYGEREYGETYDEAIATIGLEYQSLLNSKWVAGQVEISRRRENLSWSHHVEVASLSPDEQDEWLARAEANHWSHKELRQWLRRRKPKALPTHTPLLRYCQADLPTPVIVAQILRVFFPDAKTALDATYGLGGFWDGSESVTVTGLDSDPRRGRDGAVDFRDLPHDDNSFDVGFLDPPHIADGGADSIMARRFGTYSDSELKAAIFDGCQEVWRVARLGIVVKVTDHIHGSQFVTESDWVKMAIPQPVYDVVHQTRSGAMVDPKWEEQLSAYNNGSTYLIFRKDGPLHVRRSREP